jgi:hypothetical protein
MVRESFEAATYAPLAVGNVTAWRLGREPSITLALSSQQVVGVASP